MGSRGSNIGQSKNSVFPSNKETVIETEYQRSKGFGVYKDSVLEAVDMGNGNITLKYASGIFEKSDIKDKKVPVKFYIKSGIVLPDRQSPQVVNINWDKVKSVSGETYGIRDIVRELGFKWNRDKKVWEK